ncbi:hypothetical protein ACF06P_35340 [Streptomyces sp. NPDC015684]|uniref:hypothetical protein n=1 Tax=Streptomyces sp. NPDC015684 TaxID=3364963 RepID=UPI0036FAD454
MPYDTPVTSDSAPSWTLSCQYGTASSVTVSATITFEGSATEADADDALQELVDALNARSRFSGITGVKNFTSSATQNMQPSS